MPEPSGGTGVAPASNFKRVLLERVMLGHSPAGIAPAVGRVTNAPFSCSTPLNRALN